MRLALEASDNGRQLSAMTEQQAADRVEHTLAGEVQCACCQAWRLPEDMITPIRYAGRHVCRGSLSTLCDGIWIGQMSVNSAS